MDTCSNLSLGSANAVRKKAKAPIMQMKMKKSVQCAKPKGFSSAPMKPTRSSRLRVREDEYFGGLGGCQEDDS